MHWISKGLWLSKDNYYNLARTKERHTEEEVWQYALAILKDHGFQVQYIEKNVIKSEQVQKES